MNFDYGKFSDFICEGNFDDARRYKNTFIPSKLYKYGGLLDNRYIDWEQENEKRFSSLEKNEVWLSTYKYLNDPFEFKALFLDLKKVKKYGWSRDDFTQIFDAIRKHTLITCFSSNFNDCMPMWAHYANNHKGFCVEYSIDKADLIYKVSYEPTRFASASILTNLVCEMAKFGKQGQVPSNAKIRKYLTVLHLGNTVKHETWKYEDEYRLITLDDTGSVERGKSIPCSLLGIKPIGIYVGMDCTKSNRDRLVKIAHKINCPIYKMYFMDNSKNFALRKRTI